MSSAAAHHVREAIESHGCVVCRMYQRRNVVEVHLTVPDLHRLAFAASTPMPLKQRPEGLTAHAEVDGIAVVLRAY